jgi:hypothetical protein
LPYQLGDRAAFTARIGLEPTTNEVTAIYDTANLERGTNDGTDFSPNEERAINATAKPKFCAREQAKPKFFVALPTELRHPRVTAGLEPATYALAMRKSISTPLTGEFYTH